MCFPCSRITKSDFYMLLFHLIVWILLGEKSLDHGLGNCKYFKGKKIAGRICSESRESFYVTFKEKVAVIKGCENLNLKYFFFSLISNNSLVCSKLLLKSLVDGDILQVFWISQKLKCFRKKWEKKIFFFKTFKVMGIKCRCKSKNEVSQKESQKSRKFPWHFLPATFFPLQ